MDRPHQVFHCSFEFHGSHRFSDQLCSLRADDVDAENFPVVGVADDLDEAFMLAYDRRAGVGGEGELSNLTLYPASRALVSVRPTLPISGWQ